MGESSHIVKSFDSDLEHLNSQILHMGEMVIQQMDKVLKSVVENNPDLAHEVIEKDPEIDFIEHSIDTFAIRTIALRQPVASDLRAVISALKVSSHLERIADYATNIAKRAITLSEVSYSSSLGSPVTRLMRLAQAMIKDVIEAYMQRNDVKAKEVWLRDAELDEMYMSYLRELLTYMMEDPRNINACTQFLFIAKNIERIGDHVTNVAELVHYLISGHIFEEPRPKGDSDV
ncbi:MAG: phosphate signaling complex protein PhoU [Alphaproteobacteria bacterium]|nr:phosphate signaling complex protein PhoU [Alphaproteobacteria bacterium]